MITSIDNPKIKEIAKLLDKKNRTATGLFLVEGEHLIEEAKLANLLVEVFTCDENTQGTLVSLDVIKKLSSTVTPQSVVGVAKKPESGSLGSRVLVLENIQDPGNVGALIRSAVAFGFSSVLIQGVDAYSPKVLRSSQGAQFHIPIIQTNEISTLFGDYQLVGAQIGFNSVEYKQFKPKEPFMLILGNEGSGLTKETCAKLDAMVYIPIVFESLNVVVAGSILMNEYQNK